MSGLINRLKNVKKTYFAAAGVLLLILLAVSLLWFNDSTSNQAPSASPAQIYFDGTYRIGDADWQEIEKGKHIPASGEDVTLRINFHLMDPYGNPMDDMERNVPIAFYMNHIGLTFYKDGVKIRVTDNENPTIGEPACGENWTMHTFKVGGAPEQIEIVVHNPHIFGNETAIDEMLESFAVWGNIEFEKEILERGATERNLGLLLVMFSVMLLGIALFSSLIHIRKAKIIWVLGIIILFAAIYFAYNADGVVFWSESVVSNTTILGASMMLYMFFLAILTVFFMTVTQGIGILAVVLLGVANAVFFALPILSDIMFYDLWLWWSLVQIAANGVLVFCLVKEFLISKSRMKWLYFVASLPIIAFAADVLGVWLGLWSGGVISKYVFFALFIVAIIMVLKLIPNNINAAVKAKELEMEKIVLGAELAESRISTMMSQIRPHFIYNTLGSIEQLCEIDPKKAGELVHDFAKYLRGNFGELDNPRPILMSREMEHVHHYISIENVRFPDMTFSFEMKSDDFHIPALTVQPIVENAIKHGLMKLQKGGTIRVVSYETDTDYCVSVADDGVGFDTGVLLDERKHLGLRNIRERLRTMVGGSLEIESTVGVGTKVLIKIPKEAEK